MLPVIPRKAVIGTYQCTDDEMMLPVIPIVVIGTYQCTDAPTNVQMMLPVIPERL